MLYSPAKLLPSCWAPRSLRLGYFSKANSCCKMVCGACGACGVCVSLLALSVRGLQLQDNPKARPNLPGRGAGTRRGAGGGALCFNVPKRAALGVLHPAAAGAVPAAGSGRAGRGGEPEPGAAQHRAAAAAGRGAGCLQAQAAGVPGGPAAAGPAGAEAAGQGGSPPGERGRFEVGGRAPRVAVPSAVPSAQVLQYKKKCGEVEQQLLEKATELEQERLTVSSRMGGSCPGCPGVPPFARQHLKGADVPAEPAGHQRLAAGGGEQQRAGERADPAGGGAAEVQEGVPGVPGAAGPPRDHPLALRPPGAAAWCR